MQPTATNDERWLRWLELTEAALAQPPEAQLQAAEALCAQRAEIQASLVAEPSGPVDDELAGRLRQAEETLLSRLEDLRCALADKALGVRHNRNATAGYRPTLANHPLFVRKAI